MPFEADARVVLKALQGYHDRSIAGEHRAIHQRPMGDLIAELELTELLDGGDFSGDRLERFLEIYLSGLTRIYHPGNIAHQQAVPHYMAALAGLINDFVSSDGSTYEIGPTSVSIEYFLINWLLEKVGWTPAPIPPNAAGEAPHGGGVLVQGGSIGNLSAMIAARTRLVPSIWQNGNPGDLVLLAPAETHYSIARAAGIMGLGHRAVYPLEVDRRGLVIPDRLPAMAERIAREGKRVIALVANAGNTAVGMYDPFEAIGEFCAEQGWWFHIDGAHGGAALLSSRYRHLVRGMELADSVIMNAHKLMRVTATCTALLLRDARDLDHAFVQEASYLFFDKEQPGFDFTHRTIECTKPVLGLKLFMVLAALGEAGLAAYIDHQFDVTREAYTYLQGLPDFECPMPPQSNILCFLVKGARDGQLALRDQLHARGKAYISTTAMNGERFLRLTITNPATTLETIKDLVEELREIRDSDSAQGMHSGGSSRGS